MFNIISRSLLLIAFVFSLSAYASAQPGIEKVKVKFEPGANNATVEGKIKGYQVIDYVLKAQKGQSMNVSMATKHTGTYFNIIPPHEKAAAIFIGSIKGNQFEGKLKKSGKYKVRVYMMRSAARRKEVAKYRLEMVID